MADLKVETKHLSELIYETTGKSIKHIVEKFIKRPYAAFHNRHKVGKIHVTDYIKLSIITGRTMDEILMSDPRYADAIKKANEELSQLPGFLKPKLWKDALPDLIKENDDRFEEINKKRWSKPADIVLKEEPPLVEEEGPDRGPSDESPFFCDDENKGGDKCLDQCPGCEANEPELKEQAKTYEPNTAPPQLKNLGDADAALKDLNDDFPFEDV
jgi:hypothetical protein